MGDTTSHRDLDQRIEQLVREHIAAVHDRAREALDRAFAGAVGVADTGRKPARRAASSAGTGGRRRAQAELSALGERLYRAVCARPGEGIVRLAADLEVSARELQRPMAQLRQAGRVRSVGQRHLTRYFPRTGTNS
jgi:hypothetical protein